MGLSLVVSCLFCFVAFQMQGCHGCFEKERMALLDIKASFVANDSWYADSELASWVDDRASNCCNWNRVKCANISTGHVTEISLHNLNRNLQGDRYDPNWMLNVSLFRPFEELLSLDLSFNFFEDWIDNDNEGFSRLNKLEALNLSSNRLERSIFPCLNGLTSLKSLNLAGNFMDGSFSGHDFVNFSRLELLDLSGNNLRGPLYAEDLWNLRRLKILDLSYNQLNGSIQGLCKMQDLVELNLSDNMFSGQLPECISFLTNLQILDLSSNLFSGNFPSFTSNLTSIVSLSFFRNYLQGSFSLSTLANHSKLQYLDILSESPGAHIETEKTQWFPTFQLKSLTLRSCNLNKDKGSVMPTFLLHQYDLQLIDLSQNKLVGAFPSWLIQNNSRLQTFVMRSNSFVENLKLSSIRQDIGYMDISDNNIRGLLPKDIGTFLPSITYFNVSMNKFEEKIPSSIGQMKELVFLDLSHNHFSGELPEQLATNYIGLVVLKLSNNFFQGKIPKFSNQKSLRELYLNNNNFSGTVKEVLSAINTRLEVLDLSNNSISGVIPSLIGKFSSILALLMAENQLEGEIPSAISKMTGLQILDLSQNRLYGSIPYFNLSSLMFLYLQKNAFSGSIPFTLSESSQLVTLDLRDNKFSGNIPYWMDKLPILQVLLLGGNNFHGHIPIQLCQLKYVTILDLSHNMIKGSIPSCFKYFSFGMVRGHYNGSDFLIQSLRDDDQIQATAEFRTKNNYYSYRGNILENMTGLDLSCNELTGIIPSEIGNLQNIHALNLSHNYLSGSIPNTLSNLTQIESLDLSYNKLSGEIPSQLTQLNFLSIFNVSYNNLSGTPPRTGQFANFDEENYKGNPGLCGPLLKRKCEGVVASPPSQSNDAGGKETVVDMVAFYWSFIASYITILLGIITVLCINAQWRLAWFYFVGKVIRACFPTFPLY